MAVLGEVTKFHTKHKFDVQIEDFQHARFKSCSELSVEAAEIQHWEGGSNIPYKQPGRTTFTDITLERGVTSDRDLYDWFLQVSNAVANTGEVVPNFKKDLDIAQYDNGGNVVRRWTVMRAWPKKFVAGDWDNETDSVVIESVTLAFDIFKRPED